MKLRHIIPAALTLILYAGVSIAGSLPVYQSAYAGQKFREIKSLSKDDLDQLRNGKGWGLAKAAELNGVPGPVHLLEMKNEIGLTEKQIKQIEEIYNEMKAQAVNLGMKLIELEKHLNTSFESRSIDEGKLKNLLDDIADIRGKLRYVHLSAHLKTPEILPPEQIRLYNKLRGYSSGDPCKNIPVGHNAEMWKKHNNCE